MSNKCIVHSQKKLTDDNRKLLVSFVKFCKVKLGIKKLPTKITIFLNQNDNGMTTGAYDPETTEISVLGGSRMLLDILRSIAHELTHHKQNERGTLLQMVSEYDTDLNTPYENEAYERSGNLIKEWSRIVNEKRNDKLIYEMYY